MPFQPQKPKGSLHFLSNLLKSSVEDEVVEGVVGVYTCA